MNPKISCCTLGAIFYLASPAVAVSGGCHTRNVIDTRYGALVETVCYDFSNNANDRQSISINGTKILDGRLFVNEAWSKDESVWIYFSSGLIDDRLGCSEGVYLIDLSFKPPKVIQFGVKNACNEFEWASWGKKNSVIALKHDVRFTYSKGKMTLPGDIDHLWDSMTIPIPRGKTIDDMPYPDYIKPYAHEVPLPAK